MVMVKSHSMIIPTKAIVPLEPTEVAAHIDPHL